MQFQVPQFIEVEDKIFGPLTFRQFIYLAGGAGGAYLVYRLLPLFLAGPIIIVLAGLAAALAFFQFNGRPFILSLENGFFFFVHPRLYLWNNNRKPSNARPAQPKVIAARVADTYVPKLSDSKLHELSWSLDIQERIAGGISDESERTGHARPDVLAPITTARDAMRDR